MTILFRRWLAVVVAAVLLLAACSKSAESPDEGEADQAAGSSTTDASSAGEADRSDAAAGSAAVDIDETPIEVDDAVRTGTLDNGLVYYARSNDAPGGQLQLRLVVRAGSMQEAVAGSGLAHFTEHMLFNGTEAYPRNSLNDVLRGFGSEFGADLNAYTGREETVYLLTVPRIDDAAVSEAFDILDEWAERANLTEQDTLEERGVVREEFRARAESVDGVIFDVFDDIYSAGSRYQDRGPIGTEEAIEATTSDQVRDFYDRWYRPELMAVVAVGDLPAGRLEDEIRSRFSDNSDRGDGQAHQPVVAPLLTETVVQVLVHPDGPDPFVSLDYSIPNWPEGTVGGERLILLDEVVAALIQQRLDDGAARGSLPIVRPGVGTFSHARSRRFLGFNFVAEKEDEGLASVITELRSMELDGFTPEEVDRVIGDFVAAVDQMLDSADSRQDAEFASDYVEHFLSGLAIDAIDDAHERLTSVLADIDAQTASDHFAMLMTETAPLVVVVGSDAAELPTEAELRSAIESAATATPAALDDGTDVSLPAGPEPVGEVERSEIDQLDAIELRFANGARVLFRSSTIAAGQVDLLAAGSGGWSLLEPGDGPISSVAAHAVSLSGVGDLDSVDLDRVLAGSVVTLSPYIDQTSEGFFGNSASGDIELLFQLLHLLITEPRVDPGPFAEAVEAANNQVRAAETSPEFGSLIELLDARHQGDPWQVILPDQPRLDEFTAEEALSMYSSRLAAVDDLVIVVTGDTERRLVEDLARRYVGSLPAGPDDQWEDHSPDPPAGVVTREVGAGTNDSGAGFDLLITTDVELTASQRMALPVLQNLINDLLVEELREAIGASYTGGRVFLEPVDEPDVAVELLLSVSGDPDRVDLMHEIAINLLEDLATNGPAETDFESAKGVVVSDLDFINNFALLQELLTYATAGPTPTLSEAYFGTTELTVADIAAVATLVIDIDHRVEVFRRP